MDIPCCNDKYQLIKMDGMNIKIFHIISCRSFIYLLWRPWGHSGGAPVLDPQDIQSQVTAQDYTGRALSHNWNGKEQQGNNLQLILTVQSFEI